MQPPGSIRWKSPSHETLGGDIPCLVWLRAHLLLFPELNHTSIMKAKPWLATLTAGTLASSTTLLPAAGPPGILNHQGRIAAGGANYDGTGWFKFALVTGDPVVTETFWTNDDTGTGTPGGEPTAAVAVAIRKAPCAVGLGKADEVNLNCRKRLPAAGKNCPS